jgi:hypothetical protein
MPGRHGWPGPRSAGVWTRSNFVNRATFKWDFYSMDCYRLLGGSDGSSTENRLARSYAQEVIRTGTDEAGTERSP